jgi:hypothetical protein
MQFDRSKFKALIHYICDKCAEDPSKLGKVKLNKVPWHVDMAAYKNRGRPVTGEIYRKGQFGPVADHLLETVDELAREGAIAIRGVEYYGHEKFEYLSLKRPDISMFDREEIDLINEMIRYVCDENSAASISAKTHDHIWALAQLGDTIPYQTVFARAGELTPDDMKWARAEAKRLGHLR